MAEKKRLDLIIQERYPNLSRNQIQSFILQRKVKVNDQIVDKAGTPVVLDAKIDLENETPKFVSRAGFKIEGALDNFKVDVTGLVVLDAGISTGGFTDCLLQRGAKRVYGVDVGFGIVHEKLRNDPRVILYEKTNLRYLESLPELVDLATLDLSFISLLKVMPAVCKLLKPDARIITLIKPQFEAEREEIRRGGIVRDDEVHKKVIEKIKSGMAEFGFEMFDIMESPIRGDKSGNKEFLAIYKRVQI
ncbi:MAG: TlyA family RNA methyltransferase [Candidatus Babeliales bacterium]|jgi:23S rRNA (cytidine1920-2'-O)/16S rRNA (cytidine1409-2'-O)-methyltransferase